MFCCNGTRRAIYGAASASVCVIRSAGDSSAMGNANVISACRCCDSARISFHKIADIQMMFQFRQVFISHRLQLCWRCATFPRPYVHPLKLNTHNSICSNIAATSFPPL